MRKLVAKFNVDLGFRQALSWLGGLILSLNKNLLCALKVAKSNLKLIILMGIHKTS